MYHVSNHKMKHYHHDRWEPQVNIYHIRDVPYITLSVPDSTVYTVVDYQVPKSKYLDIFNTRASKLQVVT